MNKEENGYERNPHVEAQELADAPAITLGGKIFHIPRLAIAQNRVVVGCLRTLLPVVGKLESVARLQLTGGDAAAGAALLRDFPLDDEQFGRLCDAVHAAMTRGYLISRAQFDNMPVGVDEILGAILVVIQQSFAFAKKEGAPAGTAGEAAAPEPTASPTGTESSSRSAESSDGPGTT